MTTRGQLYFTIYNYDPEVFSLLQNRVVNNERNVSYCRKDRVVEIKHEFMEELPDIANQQDYLRLREGWHTRAIDTLARCDLVFLDPDTGVIEQLPHGSVRASEYSSRSEICDYDWCDLLVIQFFRPMRRFEQLRNNPLTAHAERLDKRVIAFIASSLALLYVTDKVDVMLLHSVFKRWDTKISPQILVA
ncbi:MAG: hypothetical protein ACLPX5_15190 [Dissulfurispiraceae bacterium]